MKNTSGSKITLEYIFNKWIPYISSITFEETHPEYYEAVVSLPWYSFITFGFLQDYIEREIITLWSRLNLSFTNLSIKFIH